MNNNIQTSTLKVRLAGEGRCAGSLATMSVSDADTFHSLARVGLQTVLGNATIGLPDKATAADKVAIQLATAYLIKSGRYHFAEPSDLNGDAEKISEITKALKLAGNDDNKIAETLKSMGYTTKESVVPIGGKPADAHLKRVKALREKLHDRVVK